MADEEVIKPAWDNEKPAYEHLNVNGQYTNLTLNDYKGNPGIKPGEFISVKKHPNFAEPRAHEKEGQYGPYTMYTANVIAEDENGEEHEASFVTFQDDEAEAFTNVAGVDEPIQISKEKITYVTGKGTDYERERVRERLVFRKAEQ